jgi:predicted RNase H-like HicB family nuclease
MAPEKERSRSKGARRDLDPGLKRTTKGASADGGQTLKSKARGTAEAAAGATTARAPRKFTVLLIAEPEGGYSVEVPELPGCFTEGDTLEEAMANAREAIDCYLGPEDMPPSREILVWQVEA